MMKKPEWLEKEQLYKILFESDTPRGRAFGIVTANIIDETKEKPKDGRCPRCGDEVRDNDRYCSHCGEKL